MAFLKEVKRFKTDKWYVNGTYGHLVEWVIRVKGSPFAHYRQGAILLTPPYNTPPPLKVGLVVEGYLFSRASSMYLETAHVFLQAIAPSLDLNTGPPDDVKYLGLRATGFAIREE